MIPPEVNNNFGQMGTEFIDLDINAKLPIIEATASQIIGNGWQNGHLTDLPKPSFRPAENYEYKRRTHTASHSISKKRRRGSYTTDSYFHYEDPDQESLLNRVEYDMDEQDSAWLSLFNAKNQAKYDYKVSEADFEKIMDRLEKESYFESKRSGNETIPDIDEDAVCAICNDGDCRDSNVILFCDMCDLAVHQECYGVPYIPDGQWLCRRCLQSPSVNVSCILCPNKGGAFKQTDDNRWAHVICALWVPEVCFANTVFLEPIDSIDQIPAARWKLTCYICKQKKIGACIQCHKPNCYVPFHVTCAQQAGLYMKISSWRYNDKHGEPYVDVKKEAFCDVHAPSDEAKRGMYSGEDTDDDDVDAQTYKKWKRAKRENMKKARKILAEKRIVAPNPVAEPKVSDDKVAEISKLLTVRGRRRLPKNFEALRNEFIANILGYWIERRKKRNGVHLLRRLQVSIGTNNLNKSLQKIDLTNLDKDKFEKLRYDLEKARLLVGEVKKRELIKKRMFDLSRQVIASRYLVMDKEKPPSEDDEF